MNNKLVKTLSVFLTVIILLSVAPVNLITFVSAVEEVPGFYISDSGELIKYYGKETEVVIPEGVTEICEYAFENRSDITSIKLPKSLLEIHANSFYGCTGVTELVLHNWVVDYENDLFYGVVIEKNAFAGMCRLEKLTVPYVGMGLTPVATEWFEKTKTTCSVCNGELCDSLFIEEGQYKVCKPKSLESLTINQGVYCEYALKGLGIKEVNIGKDIEEICRYGLAEAGIEILNLDPKIKLERIADYTFSKNMIKSVTIPEGVKEIGKDAFSDNEITEINLNEGLEILNGFKGAKINCINIPSTVKKIGQQAFWACKYINEVEIPEGVEGIYSGAFGGSSIKAIVLPESLVNIARSAFFGSKLEKIVLPENLSYLNAESFQKCEFLKEVVIGGSVEEISSSAFADCSSLETVVIPDSVKAISDDAFTNSTDNLVIYCNEGSYAQQYAVQNNIKYTTLVLEAIPNQTYTGKAIEPEVKAKANNKQLTLDKEYKVSFADNIESGVASVTAKGLGDFKHLVAKGKFNILPRQLNDVVVNYYNIAYYTPNGVKPKLSLYIGEEQLTEGKDYEIRGLDKAKNVGVYNISISGKGNLSGTKNFTLEVLPRSITVTKIVSTGDIKVTDSQYTLVEGVDYKVEKRTDENGVSRTYVVGIGNYTDETRLSIPNNVAEPTGLLKLFKMLLNLFSLLFGVFK